MSVATLMEQLTYLIRELVKCKIMRDVLIGINEDALKENIDYPIYHIICEYDDI